MKLFRKRRKLNNKGLSLVELVCAVAIFGLATTVIGGAMVVSAQNYSRGTYELDVQQEAQTTTNLIGDLLYDATGATFDGSATNPVMKIQGENIEYHITFDKTNKKLVYEEYVTGVATPATGTLAENVKSFSAVNLDAAGNNFKADKNVEIKLEIEKNGRTYAAEYSTTARNGVAESVGVAETAEIIIEGSIVLEPGQTYQLPFEVVGSITNKAISIADGSGVTAVENGSNISVSVATSATGTIPFTISTIEQAKDVNGNPTGVALATKTVNVNVRRVTGLTSPQDTDNDEYADTNALKSGNNYKSGASYQIDFAVAGDFMDKVYGKAYDTNYVNPRQVDITYTMTGMEPGFGVADYISGVQVVGLDNPSIKFNLIKDMPNNSEIIITATAKHPVGTNKTGNTYGSVVDVVKIKYEVNLYPDAEFMRGSDGVITCDSTLLGQIQNIAVSQGANMNYFNHLLTIYELDASGNKIAIPECHQLVVGGGMNFQIDDADSIRLDPLKKYVYKLEIMFYKSQDGSGNYTDPIWTLSPYNREYPLDSVLFTYDYQVNDNKGTETHPYTMNALVEDSSINVNVKGLEMSSNKGEVQFKVEKLKLGGSWTNPADIETVDSGKYTIGLENATKNTGKCTTKFMFREAGRYRVTAYLNNYQYKKYDGVTDATYTGNFVDGSGSFYINVN